jgi:trehalose synthase
LVPLASAVGLDAKWETIEGDAEFFRITKAMHNALQGDRDLNLTSEMFAHYVEVNRQNVARLDLEGEVVMIHDPQPLALIDGKKEGKWVWRCHVDLSDPNITIWNRLASFAVKYDRSVFSMESYIPRHFGGRAIVDYPGINPLSEKNMPLDSSQISATLGKFGVEPDKPIIGQISRFDKWKNPLGVIDVYRKVKKVIPEVQLLLIGSFASDDPEAVEWYNRAKEYAGTTPDVHVLTNNDGVEDLEVNAFQRSLAVAVQLSLREGFCLSVTEALWKGVPVVATRAGGIPLQVIDGMDGYLVNNLDEAAEKVERLIRTVWLGRQLGRMGTNHVRENFLITKRLREYLRMHIELVGLAPS